MALGRWQATIILNGSPAPGASVEVRNANTNALASLFSDRDGNTALANPFTVGSDGFAAFHVAGGSYKIEASLGMDSRVWDWVAIGTLAEGDIDDLSDIAETVLESLEIVDFIAGLIEVPGNRDYRLIVNSPVAMTINETTTRSADGTCTATFKINTTNLGGTANAVSTTEQTQAHASANELAIGDDLVLTVSANDDCEFMSFNIKTTRTLA